MCITPYYLGLIDPNDPDDPIRKMAVPAPIEEEEGGSFDTSGEQSNTRVPGLQHKYLQTAMVLTTNRCAMYCRHCFRKRLVGLTDEEIAANFERVTGYIREHEEITNVLLSGGDSFLNSNENDRALSRRAHTHRPSELHPLRHTHARHLAGTDRRGALRNAHALYVTENDLCCDAVQPPAGDHAGIRRRGRRAAPRRVPSCATRPCCCAA